MKTYYGVEFVPGHEGTRLYGNMLYPTKELAIKKAKELIDEEDTFEYGLYVDDHVFLYGKEDSYDFYYIIEITLWEVGDKW